MYAKFDIVIRTADTRQAIKQLSRYTADGVLSEKNMPLRDSGQIARISSSLCNLRICRFESSKNQMKIRSADRDSARLCQGELQICAIGCSGSTERWSAPAESITRHGARFKSSSNLTRSRLRSRGGSIRECNLQACPLFELTLQFKAKRQP